VVLLLGALLDEKLTSCIAHEDRHGAMKPRNYVGLQLVLVPDLAVVLVHQDDLFGHGLSVLSLTLV
jgi:hypothetical protein